MPNVVLTVDCEGAMHDRCFTGEYIKVLESEFVPCTWLVHVSLKDPSANTNLYYHEYQGPLAEKLCALAGSSSGMSRAFFSNSGTEAIEGAIKFARMSTGKTDIVAAMRGYHGRTLGALAATWDPQHREHGASTSDLFVMQR